MGSKRERSCKTLAHKMLAADRPADDAKHAATNAGPSKRSHRLASRAAQKENTMTQSTPNKWRYSSCTNSLVCFVLLVSLSHSIWSELGSLPQHLGDHFPASEASSRPWPTVGAFKRRPHAVPGLPRRLRLVGAVGHDALKHACTP